VETKKRKERQGRVGKKSMNGLAKKVIRERKKITDAGRVVRLEVGHERNRKLKNGPESGTESPKKCHR